MEMVKYECIVKDIEDLRLPNLYRAKTSCGDADIIVEMHNEIMSLNRDDRIEIEFTTERDECLKHEFCGNSYVVTITKLEDKYRTILSIHGPLVIIYTREKPRKPFNIMNKVYIGISRIH